MVKKLLTFTIKAVYQNLMKPVLFLFDPEIVHDSHVFIGNILGRFWIGKKLTRILFHYQNPVLVQTIAGMTFQNPVGLSAGFDKNADLTGIIPEVGFGYMQVGTITNKPYEGNLKPRLTRLPYSKSIVVNYGLKNDGVYKIVKKLRLRMTDSFPIGISIGKTNSKEVCTTKTGIEDYYACLKHVVKSNIGDFYTINISCPNVFGGEPFTTADKLNKLLNRLMPLVNGSDNETKPVFLKMPINSPWKEFKELCNIAIKHKVTGVIIGNLNKDRSDVSPKDAIEKTIKGGISGKPCWKLSNDLIGKTYKSYGKKLVIVGVGGVFSAEDAYEKIKRGASLVQLITGMIFQGPQLIGEINRGLVELLKKDGYSNISEAIGTHHKKK